MRSDTILKVHNNPSAKLHDYLQLNPNLERYVCPFIFERDRHLISKYRTGCHHLNIETGRWRRIPRDQRNCDCGPCIQNVEHIVLECPLLNTYRNFNIQSLYEFFKLNNDTIAQFLLRAERILKIT